MDNSTTEDDKVSTNRTGTKPQRLTGPQKLVLFGNPTLMIIGGLWIVIYSGPLGWAMAGLGIAIFVCAIWRVSREWVMDSGGDE